MALYPPELGTEPGILTGTVRSVARALGETEPLILRYERKW
jgi:ABC-type phosphate transport system permease subunit